jgi:PLP dependent protein
MSAISQSLNEIYARMAAAALKAGRSADSVRLVAVSKTFPVDAVVEAIAAGQRVFGENRVEEAVPKLQAAGALDTLEWHLIGHLQSRKARDAARHFALMHSIDSVKLAAKIDAQPGRPQAILLQCNVSGEASKEGFELSNWRSDTDEFERFAAQAAAIRALPNLRVRGLMTMAPIVDDAARARPVFASLRGLRDRLRQRLPDDAAHGWDELSMGMTDDFEAAIAEGATLVRIGRAIFGRR